MIMSVLSNIVQKRIIFICIYTYLCLASCLMRLPLSIIGSPMEVPLPIRGLFSDSQAEHLFNKNA